MKRALCLTPFVFLVALSARAAAEVTKEQCVSANSEAQSLRRAGKLAAAREQLLMCSSDQCPSLVSADCTKRLDELEGVQPSILFEVKDAAGRDLVGVTITMDGQATPFKLDGAAVPVQGPPRPPA